MKDYYRSGASKILLTGPGHKTGAVVWWEGLPGRRVSGS